MTTFNRNTRLLIHYCLYLSICKRVLPLKKISFQLFLSLLQQDTMSFDASVRRVSPFPRPLHDPSDLESVLHIYARERVIDKSGQTWLALTSDTLATQKKSFIIVKNNRERMLTVVGSYDTSKLSYRPK